MGIANLDDNKPGAQNFFIGSEDAYGDTYISHNRIWKPYGEVFDLISGGGQTVKSTEVA